MRYLNAAMPILLATFCATAFADPIDIDFIHPVQKKSKPKQPTVTPTEQFYGWPLTIELTMNDELGIASQAGGNPPFFPLKGDTGFVLFDDPDGCLVFDWTLAGPSSWDIPSGAACYDGDGMLAISESDETYFEFTVDIDEIGVPDSIGNPVRIAALVEATSGQPMVQPPFNNAPEPIGPRTSVFEMTDSGSVEIVDGYGYGADDDLPGLVLLSNGGTGIVYNLDGTAQSPYALRNLAGFINTVSYELNNTKSKTSINASLVIPPYLVAPVVIADESYGVLADEVNVYWRVDGASTELAASDIVGEPVTNTFLGGYGQLVSVLEYEISAMAVSGVAPDVVTDMNGDDEIDESDLELMGYTVLGDKKSITLKLFPGQPCFGGGGLDNTIFADLDNNGTADFGLVCPAGPGSVSKPPR